MTNLSGKVTYGGGSFSFLYGANDGDITIWNDNPQGTNFRDQYQVRAGGGDGVFDNDLSGYSMVAFNLGMIASSNIPLGYIISDALPLVPPALFDTPTIALTFQTDNQTSTINKLDFSLSELSQVPEPSTMLLLGFGLLGLAGYRRMRMKK